MRVLIMGGTGFIGANFVHLTVESMPDADVAVFDKLTYAGNPKSIEGPDRAELAAGDTADPNTVDPLVKNVNVVVNSAAEPHNDNSLSDPSSFTRTNIEGILRFLEAVCCHGTCFHHISTDEVYGDLRIGESRRFMLGDPYASSSLYSSSEGALDPLVRVWVCSFGVPVTISNCSNSYGLYQRVEKFIPRTITNMTDGIRPCVYRMSEQACDWIYVRDHNTAVWEITDKGCIGETYLIEADGEKNNLEVVQMILAEFGRKPDDLGHVSDRSGHDQRYAIDNSKSAEETGWNPSFADFATGLHDAAEWYKTNEDQWCPQKDDAEVKYAKTGQ